jgi:hypothetical protein
MGQIEQALSIVEQALNAAAKSGTFALQDAAVVNSAFGMIKEQLTPKETADGTKVIDAIQLKK